MVSVVTGTVVVVTGGTIAGVWLIRMVTCGAGVVVGMFIPLAGLVVVGRGTVDDGLMVTLISRAPGVVQYPDESVPGRSSSFIPPQAGSGETGSEGSPEGLAVRSTAVQRGAIAAVTSRTVARKMQDRRRREEGRQITMYSPFTYGYDAGYFFI
jgi:hypothetical protein